VIEMTKKKEKKEKPKIEIKWKTAAQVYEERKDVKRVPTGTPIDELIGGGIEQGEVIEFYGEYGSGKTQLCNTLICNITGDVIYIDTENTFKPERLHEIASNRGLDPEAILKRVHLIQPLTSSEQAEAINQIPENIIPQLIIIDSLMTLYREEYIGRGTLAERQGLVRQHIRTLKDYARKNKTAIIVTNQVYATPDASPFLPLEYREQAVGGHTVYHSIDNRIFIRKAKQGTRIAKLMDSSMHPPGERLFKITEKGVESTQ